MTLTKTTLAALAVAAASMSGCVSMSRSSAVSAVSADWTRDGRVVEVRLTGNAQQERVATDFQTIFERRVQSKLDGCAPGQRPLRLEATVDQYYRSNPVITTLVAGRNRIRGTATLIDTATGQTVGRYNIGKTIVGGRIGIIAMGPAQTQLSDAFGDEVCKQAFGR